MNPGSNRIYVAGHRGMVGAAILRQLMAQGVPEEDFVTRTHAELDLTDQAAVRGFFAEAQIDEVYLAAAKVGGIHANNTLPAEFIYENLMIEANIIDAAFRSGVKKLLFLGSSCIYPRLAPQPMREDALLTGPLEPTNEPYAIAKIAGIKLCESYNRQYGSSHGIDYRSVMPTNLYGPGDNYDLENSHVIPALIRKFHEAKVNAASEVVVWGTGRPRREFLYVDDMAHVCMSCSCPATNMKSIRNLCLAISTWDSAKTSRLPTWRRLFPTLSVLKVILFLTLIVLTVLRRSCWTVPDSIHWVGVHRLVSRKDCSWLM
jgi:GDP-L-fucose synthase